MKLVIPGRRVAARPESSNLCRRLLDSGLSAFRASPRNDTAYDSNFKIGPLASRVGARHEVERRSRRDELLSFLALLKLPDNTMRVLHHPPAHVPLVDG